MIAVPHVGSKRGMPIHRLLNEDAVALAIASIPTRPVLSINDSRPLFPLPSAENKIYVQPRSVDGGYGVQVLEPGYWTVPKQAAEH
jgi:hypothetical protein